MNSTFMTARITLIILGLTLAFPVVSGHERPMIGLGYPPPPPTVDPGPEAALVRVTIRDAKDGEKLSATVSVNRGAQEPDHDPYRQYSLRHSANRHKGPLRYRNLDYYFFTDGSFSVRVPPGLCTVQVRKGYEYSPVEQVIQVSEREVVESTIYLERWIDMARKGWYSGDLHLHMARTGDNEDELFTLTSARDIRYGFILSMNTKGYDRGREFESWPQSLGLGDRSNAVSGQYFLSSGQEYRAEFLGHVNIVLREQYIQATGRRSEDVSREPSLAVIADETHEQRGFIGLCHGGYDHMEADRLGLEGKSDFLELYQFGGYRGLGLDGWYDFLNIGYRWPIVAGSDFPYTRELGDCLTYAYSEHTPTPREFVEQVSRGASFVTSGPMVFVTINGKRPGEAISFPNEGRTDLQLRARILSPLHPVRYVEVIRNGQVVSRRFDPKGRSRWEFGEQISLEASGWIAVRAYSDAGTDSHTNPVYIYMAGKRPFSADSCDQILTRLNGSLRTIPNPDIQNRIKSLKTQLKRYRDQGETDGLALPTVPTN